MLHTNELLLLYRDYGRYVDSSGDEMTTMTGNALNQNQSNRDLIILSNGPGELATWVYPTLCALAEEMTDWAIPLRVSVVLSPCSNASGQEAEIAARFPLVSRVLPAQNFMDFLLWGKTTQGITVNEAGQTNHSSGQWDWYPKGVVLFLGGDQFYPLVIGKRLGYSTVIYAEWEARWWRWADRFAVRNQTVADRIPSQFAPKVSVIGDLMVDTPRTDAPVMSEPDLVPEPTITLLPGSKGMKLRLGVPLFLGVADELAHRLPKAKFRFALAPTVSLTQLLDFARPGEAMVKVGGTTATLIELPNQRPVLRTPQGTMVELFQEFPAHDVYRQSAVCVTTAGANTAELAALHVPMVMVMPTNIADAMQAWDGLVGIMIRLPVVGNLLVRLVNYLAARAVQREGRLLAWPNIWAKREIVPEMVQVVVPADIAAVVMDLLADPARLRQIKQDLREVCGETGAARKLVAIVKGLMDKSD
jgi:lipid A disaccharide synthetase